VPVLEPVAAGARSPGQTAATAPSTTTKETTSVSWFPELLAHRPEQAWPQDSFQLVPFYRGLVELTPETLLASWSGAPQVEDPRHGLVRGADAFAAYAQETREWLALSDATAWPGSVTQTAMRSVEEVVLDPEVGGARQELGAAVVAEWDRDHRLTAVRVYHSLPLVAGQRAHLPVAPVEAEQRLPAFVREHLGGRDGDLDDLLGTYEDDARLTTFTDRTQVVSGHQELRRLHRVPAVPGSGLRTTICTVSDDGRSCAVEHRVTRDGSPEPVEAGVTVYERGPHGKVQQERRYAVLATAAFAPVAAAGSSDVRGRVDLGRRSGSYATAGSLDG